jgi:hypothetical protein
VKKLTPTEAANKSMDEVLHGASEPTLVEKAKSKFHEVAS